MAEYQSVPVPFVIFGNRRALTDEQVFNDPCLREFIELFESSFERDHVRHLWIFIEPETKRANREG